jgi:hypothetical protein
MKALVYHMKTNSQIDNNKLFAGQDKIILLLFQPLFVALTCTFMKRGTES